jgi:Flp pilus assembly pilin Flp
MRRFLGFRSAALSRLVHDTRGATMVEYSLLLFLILVTAAPILGLLGKKVNTALRASVAVFDE